MIKPKRLYKLSELGKILFGYYSQKEYNKLHYQLKKGLKTVTNIRGRYATHRVRGEDLIKYLKDNTIEGTREEFLDYLENYQD